MNSGFVTPTAIDVRAWLWVASFLSFVYSVLCLAARFVGKWDMLWWDDLVLGAGYMASVVHWGMLFHAIAKGLGIASIAISSSDLSFAARVYFGSRIAFFAAHCLSKLSIIVFTRRIFSGDIYKEKVLFGIAYAMIVLYGIAGILLSSAGCRPDETLVARVDAVCDANTARWAVITVWDCLTELIILAMPIWFISKNQLKASKKRIVIFVYMFRLIVIAFSIATTVSYFNFLHGGGNSISISPVVAWQEVHLGFSLISASFPCLRTFLWAFMSRGVLTMYGNTTVSHSESRSQGASLQLRSMTKSQTEQQQQQQPPPPPPLNSDRPRLRPESQFEYSVHVRGDAPESTGKNNNSSTRRKKFPHHDLYISRKKSDDSDQMIIRQETSYRVESSSFSTYLCRDA
ncbi:uncharacterized protein SEPMUDRAFT_145730 [Sphaerulina musiva SO2202]|uniref:Rhodopsin domain-containing protein n=1 Tax=Sphaerulina musiva (strain SO2202) TaxID=692275 RepID=N1QH36_SPHMS|nr:uncharacterized protein SEPMUDRAFT_145730 [Sphaerulina musiva SO2202]EMF16495.1 hypothetical protein SEPMUDRAFT_145730 [Sphaerulina musiva SO2202]